MNSASAPSSADGKSAVIESRPGGAAPRGWLLHWFDQLLPGRGTPKRARFLHRLIALLRLPAPDTSQIIRRVIRMERDIVLPIKVAGIAMLIMSFFFSHWIGLVLDALAIAVEATRSFLLVYILVNVVTATVLFAVRSLPTAVVEWSVMITC